MNVFNAKIEETELGYEDHRILTCGLQLKGENGNDYFGGYSLDSFDKIQKRRIGIAYGAEFIARILQTVGCDKWEQLRGKLVRIRVDGHKIHAIGHIIDDIWFSPEELAKEFIPMSDTETDWPDAQRVAELERERDEATAQSAEWMQTAQRRADKLAAVTKERDEARRKSGEWMQAALKNTRWSTDLQLQCNDLRAKLAALKSRAASPTQKKST